MRDKTASLLELLAADAEIVAGMGSYIWDPSTDELVWSDNCYRLLECEPKSVEPSIELFMAAVHPEDRERVGAMMERVLKTGEAPAMEYRLMHSGGPRRVLSRGMAAFGEDGELLRIVGTIQDITLRYEREQAAETNARLLEEAQAIAHVGSWVWRPASGYITWSPELYRITGMPFDHKPTVESFDSLVHPDDLEELQRVRSLAVKTMSPTPYEVRIVRPDGVVRVVSMRAHTVDDADEQWFLGVVHDVTEQRQLEQRLQQRQILEAIGRLASGVAHDFNNLLTVIIANADGLQRKHRMEELDDVLQAATAATELTQRLLSLGRTGQMPPVPTDLDDHLRKALSLLSRAVGEEFELKLELGGPPPVSADARQLDQVLLNLVINARDAMPTGGVITVRTRADRGGAILEIEDHGTGMSDEVRSRALEPFFTTKGPGTGSGLGLSMVHGAMLAIGGDVTVESVADHGTVVRLRFVGVDRQVTAPPRDEPVPVAAKGARILIVEDEPAVRRVTARLLRGFGFEIEQADGPESAEEFLDAPLDLVLCDVAMPKGGGKRVLDTFRRVRPELPFMFMTGYAERDDWLAPYRVVAKPFLPEQLKRAVNEVLAGSSAR